MPSYDSIHLGNFSKAEHLHGPVLSFKCVLGEFSDARPAAKHLPLSPQAALRYALFLGRKEEADFTKYALSFTWEQHMST